MEQNPIEGFVKCEHVVQGEVEREDSPVEIKCRCRELRVPPAHDIEAKEANSSSGSPHKTAKSGEDSDVKRDVNDHLRFTQKGGQRDAARDADCSRGQQTCDGSQVKQSQKPRVLFCLLQ